MHSGSFIRTLSFLLLLNSFHSSSQEEKKLNPDSLVFDLRILTTSLKENHPLMFSYISKERFDSLTADAALQVKKGMTGSQFYFLVSKLLGSTGCGHTYAYQTAASKNRMRSINDLPFEIAVHDGSVYMAKSHIPGYGKYTGKKIN